MKIAFFDLDGTITKKDTMLEVIKYQKGTRGLYAGFLINAPTLISLKAKIVSNKFAKERVLKYFFAGTPLSTFQEACDNFADKMIPKLIRKGAIEEIKRLQDEGFEVVIVSASAENWIQKWSNDLGLQLIATHLEIKKGFVTGKLNGKNCHGKEKVARIMAAYDLSKYHEIYAYGDTAGDKSMLKLATQAFYKPFRK